MTVIENQDRWKMSNVTLVNRRVTQYETAVSPGTHRFLGYGIRVIRVAALDGTSTIDPPDLVAVLPLLVKQQPVLALKVTRRSDEIGIESLMRATRTSLLASETS